MSDKVLLVGTGAVAREYAKVLNSLDQPFVAVGRSEDKAQLFAKEFGCEAFGGGVHQFISSRKNEFQRAINASTTEHLFEVSKCLLENGVKFLFSEKPGSTDRSELLKLEQLTKEVSAHSFIAYNRRSFSSVVHLRRILQNSNAQILIQFDFTEWIWRIDPNEYPQNVLVTWIYCNSAHVIDLAFYLGGKVESLSAMSRGEISWHKKGAQFVGSGKCQNGLFSYASDWSSAGRWKVEVCTTEGKYILCPLEKLFFIPRGKLDSVEISVDDDLDKKFKPGFYRQTKLFLENNFEELKSVSEQIEFFKVIDVILTGGNI